MRVPYLHRWNEALALAQARRSLWPAAAGSFLAGLAEAGVLVIITYVATSFIEGGDAVSLWGMRFGLVAALWVGGGLLLTKTMLMYAVHRRNTRTAELIQVRLRGRLMRAYFNADWEQKSARTIGDLQELASGYANRASKMMLSLSNLLTAVLGLAAFLFTSLLVSPVITLGVVVISSVVLLFLRPVSMSARRLIAVEASHARSYASLVTESNQVGRDIETFHVGGPVQQRLAGIAEAAGVAFRQARVRQAMVPIVYQAVMFGFALIGLGVTVGHVTPGSLASIGAVVLLMLRSLSSAQQVISRAQQVNEQTVYLTGIADSIGQFEAAAIDDGAAVPARVTPIVLENVTFTYPGKRTPAFELNELSIGTGESIGVVGRSGAGKSTLVQLLLRLRRPTTGVISAGGVPLGDIDRAWWAKRVAFVPQEPQLISGTVAENVAFFRPIDEAQIRRALKRAELMDELERLPLGIHTPLGGKSGTLSGGQRQRVALARALAGDPQVIVLDEPTSALDPVSERLISQMLTELRGEVTLIIVAHRLETLASCDRVMVLEDGSVAALDRPDALAQMTGYFSEAFGKSDGASSAATPRSSS
jgi:ATP-binding cassette, subfamily B, bacterial